METNQLNELVAHRQSMCEQGAISIDLIDKKIKIYTKKKFIHSNKPKDKSTAEVTEKQIVTTLSQEEHLPSGIFKFLGVDYVGGFNYDT